MSYETVIQELVAAQSSEQKAAIVADAVIHDLPTKIAKVALGCCFLPWFSVDLIKGLLGSDSDDSAIEKIINLPFVETTSLGYCFHSSTRRGLLQKYKSENPSAIAFVFDVFQKQLDTFSDAKFQSLMLSLYGYVITNQGLKAEELLLNILEEGKTLRQLDVLSLLDEAEEFCISEGIGLTPNYWFYRGNIFLLEQDFESAIKYCNKALERDKNFYHAYSIRSIAQAQLGNFDEAFHDIDVAIRTQPDEYLYRSRAILFLLKKDYKSSIFDFTRALRINPKDIQAYIGRANIYLLSKKVNQAFHDLDSALALSEDHKSKTIVYTFYATALIERREFKEALVFYDKLTKLVPTTGIYRRMGNILFELGKFKEAQESYEQSLKLDDQNQYAYIGRGKLYLIEGDYENAILDFEKALSIREKPNLLPLNALDNREANLRLWETYIKLENKDEAEKQKNTLINTQNKMELLEILLFCRKYTLFETMLEVSIKLIEVQSVSSITYTPAGYALNQLGDYKNAIKYFEMEEKTSSSDATDKINLGISYWGLKEYEKAKGYFEKANKDLNKKPKNSNFHSIPKSGKTGFANKVWLKVMLGNLTSALHSIEEYLQSNDILIDEFYDLRDWGLVVKRSSNFLPKGFDEFYDRVKKVIDMEGNSIYRFNKGI